MRRFCSVISILVAFADEPGKEAANPGLSAARQAGWEMAAMVIEKLEAGNLTKFPGIKAWLDELRRNTKGVDAKTNPEKWPPFDVDALVTNNPKFWRAGPPIRRD